MTTVTTVEVVEKVFAVSFFFYLPEPFPFTYIIHIELTRRDFTHPHHPVQPVQALSFPPSMLTVRLYTYLPIKMSFISLPTPTQALIILTLLYTIYHIISALDLWNRRRAFKRDRGVQDAPRLPQKDPILGLDLFFENIASLKNHTLLETTAARFRDTGFNTFRLVALGRHMHATLEPENLKTIQAIDHKKWGLGTRRKIGFRPLLGDGEFFFCFFFW